MGVILVVEDRPDTRNMIVFALKKAGYPTLEANDGEQALKIINEKNVDVVISDILMPKIDGKELLKAIRSDKNNDKVKVIMLTASKVSDEEQKEYLKMGANGFLLKPIQIAELRAELKKHIKYFRFPSC